MADSPAERAARWGIEPAYTDVRGVLCRADDETLSRIVAALSASGAPPAPPALAPALAPAFQGDGRKAWLLAVQLYGVRSRSNWGHGDFGDLAALLELVAELGCAGVGLNPLHALRPRRHRQPLCAEQPAVSQSALYRHGRGRGHAARLCRRHAAAIEQLRSAELVDYTAVAALKFSALRAAYDAFQDSGSAARRQEFEAYRAERGAALERFAAFETLRGHYSGPWQQWPRAMAAAERRGVAGTARSPRRRPRLPRIPAMERRAPDRALP